MLHRRGEDRAAQTKDQTEQPRHIDPDNRSWRFGGTVLHYDRYPGGDIDELGELRDRPIARIGRASGKARREEGRDNG